ncbi:MAG TPA: hydroxymethylbilane synthase [Bryobacteraceae bacterium]|nr:hydroxymethylbilane synthase [Bryobacteraceae bacterium]
MLIIGSRGSQLALWQANWVREQLAARGQECRIEIIHTTGDKILDVPLSQVGSKGVFTKEIEDALLAGSIDIAVHSLKDMPTAVPEGLTIASIPAREDARDALIGYKLHDLPRYAKVGTSSLRRTAQLKAIRPDLRIESLRGNVDTRLRKLDEGQHDAIVLAAAGLKRLGWESRITEILSPEVMCPAVGQGALAIETREDKGPGFLAARLLNDNRTALCVVAERTLLAALGGGCQIPMGAYAHKDNLLHLQAVVVSPNGAKVIRRKTSGDPRRPELLGERLAQTLLDSGAGEILK